MDGKSNVVNQKDMNIVKNMLISAFLFLIIWGCDEKELVPISFDKGIPGVITDINVINIAGGAKIEYSIPDDNDLLYVKAVYSITNGRTLEAKASLYEKTLFVKGYNDTVNTKEYDVALTTIDRSNNESEPVIVKIRPELSPLQQVRNTIDINESFGGVRYTWNNEAKEPVTLFFLADTITEEGAEPGELVETRIINTKIEDGVYADRGYESVPRQFGVILADNYGNKTELIRPSKGDFLTPLHEEKLDKSLMHVYNPGENPVEIRWNFWEGQPSKIIDDDRSHTSVVISYQQAYPRYLTIDLGKVYKMSRYVWFQRNHGDWAYSFGNPKTWSVYVRQTPPVPEEEILEDLDGDGKPDWMNHWTLMDHHEIVKPSGLPVGQLTQEDRDAALDGHNFDFPPDLEGVRYIRYGVTSNFDGSGWCNFSEIDFYGTQLN